MQYYLWTHECSNLPDIYFVIRFNQILCQRSFAHLRAVFDEYQKTSKKTMEDVIKSEFSGDIKDGFVTVGKLFFCLLKLVELMVQ